MIRVRCIYAITAFFVALTLCFGASAQAQMDPLVIIRFNQPRIYYEKQLYRAVAKAVGMKPSVVFDLVSYVPTVADPKRNAGWQITARQNVQSVMNSLSRMGVPPSRVSYRAVAAPEAEYDEVHVFVR